MGPTPGIAGGEGDASDVFGPVGPVDPVFEGVSFDLASDLAKAARQLLSFCP